MSAVRALCGLLGHAEHRSDLRPGSVGFIAGLMIGRTPVYLGKKLGPSQLKLTVLAALVTPLAVLVVVAISTVVAAGTTSQPGVHGLTEMLYASASAANGNGSAMGGLTVNGTWWLTSLAVAMLVGRFLVIVAVVALAGSFIEQPRRAGGTADLDTGSSTFTMLLLAVVLIVGGTTYFASLALTVIRAIRS
ncbi:MAG: potassium-transporting ATPase subunit KdpA [Ilumatobacteraceae bacterium]|nr:potassium-transporting ATPase subunit KdpA [Ilumatobacteraceae bacterium]